MTALSIRILAYAIYACGIAITGTEGRFVGGALIACGALLLAVGDCGSKVHDGGPD